MPAKAGTQGRPHLRPWTPASAGATEAGKWVSFVSFAPLAAAVRRDSGRQSRSISVCSPSAGRGFLVTKEPLSVLPRVAAALEPQFGRSGHDHPKPGRMGSGSIHARRVG